MHNVIHMPAFLLPQPQLNLTAWSVVACDQFTSQPEYWKKAEEIVKDAPSTLRIIYPEAALLSGEPDRAPAIHACMRQYLQQGIFAAPYEGFVLVERSTSAGLRLGLLALIDLEAYDYSKGSQSLIRPTEGTIAERIPPRVHIRAKAPLELPHVMLLADDPQGTLVEPLYEKKNALPLLYDFELMLGGGHLRGFLVNAPEDVQSIYNALQRLPSLQGEDSILFAVGDGNHSLATAKQCYLENPTAHNRYALVEIVNLYQPSLQFEPIHRLLHGVDKKALTAAAASQGVSLATGDVTQIQPFLDAWLPESAATDYIHGEQTLLSLAAQPGYTGLLLKGIEKQKLFPLLVGGKTLPRKAFSMGNAQDKRYYLECRKLL